jgi:hypothetical protein
MLNLTKQKDELRDKIKCYFTKLIADYIYKKQWGYWEKRDKIFKELQNLKYSLFILDQLNSCEALDNLEKKFEAIMATIDKDKCFNDDCIKQSVIEKLIEDAIAAIPDPPVLYTSVDLTTGQLLNIGVSPVEIVANPGIGKAIQVIGASYHHKAGATPFDATLAALVLKSDTTTQAQVAGAISVWSSATDAHGVMVPTASSTLSSILANRSLVLTTNDGVDLATGNGTGTVHVQYTIIDV